MSERKVLNKYYPPDFDPSKIPRMKQAKDGKFGIRLMAPFNMRCNTCGEYIYKGKKFNSRKETVSDEKYLGLYIFRFYIKCPRCIAEIAFKTDPENTDYTLEAGATRNFEALKTAERLAMKEAIEKEEDEKNNPMKVLENRTKASLQEMDMMETLEELREIRAKQHTVDLPTLLRMNALADVERLKRQEAEDEAEVQAIFGPGGSKYQKRLPDDDDVEDEDIFVALRKKMKHNEFGKPSSVLNSGLPSTSDIPGKKSALASIIIRKKTGNKSAAASSTSTSAPCSSSVSASSTPASSMTSSSTCTSCAPVSTICNSAGSFAATSASAPIGLAGLAAYASDSDDDDDNG